MVMLLAMLLWFQTPPAPTSHLQVKGGTGSGNYVCGAEVQIEAEKRHGDEVFAQWFFGWDGEVKLIHGRVHERKITIQMPCHQGQPLAAIAEARFTAKPPKGKR
jgi:hypothetical protein